MGGLSQKGLTTTTFTYNNATVTTFTTVNNTPTTNNKYLQKITIIINTTNDTSVTKILLNFQ